MAARAGLLQLSISFLTSLTFKPFVGPTALLLFMFEGWAGRCSLLIPSLMGTPPGTHYRTSLSRTVLFRDLQRRTALRSTKQLFSEVERQSSCAVRPTLAVTTATLRT